MVRNIRAVSLIGSNRGERSRTNLIAKSVIGKINEGERISINLTTYTTKDLKVKECIGCNNCFLNAQCALDKLDGLDNFKNELLESDFIILGSPVYFHNVSGSFKVVIDRLAYWSHILRLTGKVGMTISTSSNNGNIIIDEYLKKIFSYFGVACLANLSLKVDELSEEALESYIEFTAKRVESSLINRAYPITDEQESIFTTFKRKYLSENVNKEGSEYNFWLKNKMFEYDTFNDFFQSKL